VPFSDHSNSSKGFLPHLSAIKGSKAALSNLPEQFGIKVNLDNT
jgi:hypothetical protein